METIIFDIETGPLPDVMLDAIEPEFEAAANLKDPEKIAADLAKKRAAWRERAALSPLTGRVLAVGFAPDYGEKPFIIGHDDEAKMLAAVWDTFRTAGGQRRPQFVGFNVFGFDLPFLVRRSWINGVPVPPSIRHGRYWSDMFVDLRELWQLGDRQAEGSLDSICRALGIGQKNGNGAEFARMWIQNRAEAEAYLLNDLAMTGRMAGRLM